MEESRIEISRFYSDDGKREVILYRDLNEERVLKVPTYLAACTNEGKKFSWLMHNYTLQQAEDEAEDFILKKDEENESDSI